jgi:outer membrane protein assembly factor BamB
MELLFIGTNGRVSAINPAAGSILWTTELKGGSFLANTGGQDVSVLVHQGTVYAGCCGHLFGLDAVSGNILWHNELKGHGHNDISLTMDGVSVQFVQKVVRRQN